MSVFKRNGVGNYYIQFNYKNKTYIKSSKTINKEKIQVVITAPEPTHGVRFLIVEEEKRLLVQLDSRREIPYRPKFENRCPEENRKRQDMYDLVVLLLDTGGIGRVDLDSQGWRNLDDWG